MSRELSNNKIIIVLLLIILFFSGLIVAVIFDSHVVSLTIICILLFGAFYLAWRLRIKKHSIIDVPSNKLKILGYEMKEAITNEVHIETKIRV